MALTSTHYATHWHTLALTMALALTPTQMMELTGTHVSPRSSARVVASGTPDKPQNKCIMAMQFLLRLPGALRMHQNLFLMGGCPDVPYAHRRFRGAQIENDMS